MGKLAERYGDANRSGVYRVRDATIPRAAAAEAGLRLVELRAAALANGGWDALRTHEGSLVVLVTGAPEIGPEFARLLQDLEARARAARAQGASFFAVMVDPRAELSLPRLYKEQE